MASQMQQSHSHHRRNPAGQGIVVRPSVGKEECRYCHEVGHHISRWNRQTKTKELTCPKLIAKEERKRNGGRRRGGGGARRVPQASTNCLGGWVSKAVARGAGGRAQPRFVQNSRPVQRAPVAMSNRFAALSAERAWGVKVEIRAPKAVAPLAPVGVWGASASLRGAIAKVVEREETAEAIGLVAKAIVAEAANKEAVGKLESLPKVAKKVSFAGDSESLLKPPCDTKLFRKEDPPIVVSSDEEVEEEEQLVIGKNAWRPKRATQGMTGHERQTILDEIRTKQALLEELETDGAWADADEIDELTVQIAELEARLA
jgi:hypothetical protein